VLSRNTLFGLGILALLAGAMLSALWFYQAGAPAVPVVQHAITTQSILLAARPIPAGTLVRAGDMTWGEVPAAEVVGADIPRGSIAETEFVGAVTRRSFAAQEPLTTFALIKPSDRDFLVAALGPGFRAFSINVDAVQSTSGLMSPGDHVDVLLSQIFPTLGTDTGHKSVGEIVLRNLRVIAVDQTLSPGNRPAATTATLSELRMPKTITLEVTDHQAAVLLVAEQLGKIQLALRGQQDQAGTPTTAHDEAPPTWASDVSPALAGSKLPSSSATQGSIEVMHGAKIERRCLTGDGLLTCP
jgi:pilus assembly protein CpaB